MITIAAANCLKVSLESKVAKKTPVYKIGPQTQENKRVK